MPKGPKLSEYEKGQIQALHANGSNVSQIARQIHRSRDVITKFLNNPQEYGTKKSTGRPTVVTPRNKRRIINAASNSTIGVRQIKKDLDLEASRETIRKVIKNCPHIQRSRMSLQPKLTEADKANRLEFARQHMTWNNEWQNVS